MCSGVSVLCRKLRGPLFSIIKQTSLGNRLGGTRPSAANITGAVCKVRIFAGTDEEVYAMLFRYVSNMRIDFIPLSTPQSENGGPLCVYRKTDCPLVTSKKLPLEALVLDFPPQRF